MPGNRNTGAGGSGARQDSGSSGKNDCHNVQSPQVQGRAGNASACATCGERLRPKRGSRRQRYCSYRCRDEARRARNFANLATTRRGSPAMPRSVENNGATSKPCEARFADRAPVELLGHGYRWPGARRLGLLRRNVIDREIGHATGVIVEAIGRKDDR
jgi:hypothetical protein